MAIYLGKMKGQVALFENIGMVANIFITGLNETDTVTATFEGKEKPVAWNSENNRFEVTKIVDQGVWTITATNGKDVTTQEVLVDAAAEYEIEMGYTQAVCDTPVELLDLSVRSYNALMRANCKTVGQAITAINQQSLQGMRNLGRKSVAEIRSLIVEYGYKQLSETRKREFLLNLLQINGNKEE